MRRLAFAAAVCGSMLLAACSDQSQAPTEPAAPAPDANFGTCQPVRFPILNVARLIDQVFKGKTRNEALLRAAAVAVLWDTCHEAAAQKVAVNFVNWIDLNAPKNAPASKVLELKIAVLNGVGIPVDAPPAGSLDDFGVGLFDPGNTTNTLIKTKSGRALVELEPGSFLEPTVITISRKADNFQLTNFEGDQFPPAYDYDATNASGNHVLQPGKTAIVAFCLLFLDDVAFPGGYPANRAIGHNPVAGQGQPAFEILEAVNLVAEGLRDDLDCPEGTLPDPVLSSFGDGPSVFANAALRIVGRYLGSIMLPQPLWAATMLGTLPPPPPLGGKAGSLSPFKVVERTVTTSTSLTSSSSLATVGQVLTLTAVVSPAPPTTQEPSVEFFDGTTSLGFGSLNSDGHAQLTTESLSLTLAQHSLTAKFPGTSTHGASTSSVLVQNTVQRFNDLTSFNAALGGASTLTQDFEGFDAGTPISTVITDVELDTDVLNVTSTFGNLSVFLTGVDKVLFGSDETTRQEGTGRYDLTFVAPLTNNAIAFNVEGKDPATAPATAIVTAGAGSASSSVQNASGSELTPAFVGFIASAPIVSVRFNEGPEVGGTGNEETALDDFVVAQVPLP